MLRAIEISGYRGIRTGLVRGFERVNLIVGPNGSGKSTVLEAIFLGAWEQGPAFSYRNNPLLAHRHNEQVFPSRECVYGKRDGVAPEVRYEFDSHSSPLRLNLTGSPIATWKGAVTGQMAEYFKRLKLLDIQLLLDKEMERQAWDRLLQERADRALAKALKFVYGLDIESFSYSATSLSLKVLFNDRPFPLNVDDLGVGMRLAFRLFGAVILSPNSAVLAEEVDGYQHVSSYERFVTRLLELATEYDVQLFFSTHRLETIRTFLDVAAARATALKVFQTSLSFDGELASAGMTADDAKSLVEGGFDLRRTADAH